MPVSPDVIDTADLGKRLGDLEQTRRILTPPQMDAKGGDTRSVGKGGETKRGKFKGWHAYRDAREAAEAEAAAVAFVNEGIVDAPPLTEDDLADSRASAEWLKSHERKGLVEEGTLPHAGRPRFASRNGFLETDEYGFQGDRFSNTVPVDMNAYRRDPEAYRRSGRWAVVPSVYPDGDGVTRLHTADAAEAAYRRSGGHFGIYEGQDNANNGALWDHHKGNAEWAEGRETRQDALGGETPGPETAVSETPVSEAPAQPSGPRIVINPQVFKDKRDALCVAFNEAFRVVMEMNGFEPASEPTEAQRKFFSDTAYADDELQLRRTILARIATLDTSVKDPTDEQLEETAEMLEMVMEVGAPQSEWEQSAVKRLHDVVVKSLESTRANGGGTQAPPEEEGSARAAEGGGRTDEEKFFTPGGAGTSTVNAPQATPTAAPDAVAAEDARRQQIAEEQRERDRPRIGAANPNAVPVASRQDLRELAAQNITPTDAAAKGYAAEGNIAGVVAMGVVKAAETFGAAKATGTMGQTGAPIVAKPVARPVASSPRHNMPKMASQLQRGGKEITGVEVGRQGPADALADNNGTPITVYRGERTVPAGGATASPTPNQGAKGAAAILGPGVYVSESPKTAAGYAAPGGRVIEGQINPKAPLVTDNIGQTLKDLRGSSGLPDASLSEAAKAMGHDAVIAVDAHGRISEAVLTDPGALTVTKGFQVGTPAPKPPDPVESAQIAKHTYDVTGSAAQAKATYQTMQGRTPQTSGPAAPHPAFAKRQMKLKTRDSRQSVKGGKTSRRKIWYNT